MCKITVSELSQASIVKELISGFKANWLLRMSSHSFIMMVNKHTKEYVNLYAQDNATRELISLIANSIDKHEKMLGE